MTPADYARAEKFLAAAVNPLVVGGSVAPNWLPDERFWYRSTTADGVEFVLDLPGGKVPGARLRSREARGRPREGGRRDGQPEAAAVPDHPAVS